MGSGILFKYTFKISIPEGRRGIMRTYGDCNGFVEPWRPGCDQRIPCLASRSLHEAF